MKSLSLKIICFIWLGVTFAGSAVAQSAALDVATAWHEGRFHFDVGGIIGRSDIVLGRPNVDAAEAMPLGNGRLGVAVWSAGGLTAQLNRGDTMPDRLSPGQVVIPGIAALTRAKDYSGRLDLYHGEFREQGGGMTVTAWVEPDTDTLIVDVTGANPHETQTAQLRLWALRIPQAQAKDKVGLLSETWLDNKHPESSGRAFGSLSAITADGRGVSAAVTDPLTITITFTPYEDGHFKIIAAAPHYEGKGDSRSMASRELLEPPEPLHRARWEAFWNRTALIKITSQDGAGEYMENLRAIYLYVAAVEKGEEFPGTHAGIADMINAVQDTHKWDPSAFWHWNLRMQVAANIGAGLAELNAPYFNLYRENLVNMEEWTRKHMNGRPGICVPETMRFNGRGIEYESTWETISMGLDCATDFKPYYNARTLTTGAEVSLWVWQQYLATNDRVFLERNYPLMASSARFLLAYQKPGADGMLHTEPSNAHETQWDVTDPTTDLAAIKALYPVTIQAATLLGKDAELVRQLHAALGKIPELPRTQASGKLTLLPASADGDGADVIAESYQPGAEMHNLENIGLEPVWPYGLIGDTSPLFALARRTFTHRLIKGWIDWSFDPIQAARLGLGDEVGASLVKITEKVQKFPNGMAKWEPTAKEFYVEQTGVVADALQEALVQDYDGVIRVAPAIPPGWDFDGSVYVRGRTKVDVQTRNDAITTVAIEAGTTQPIKIRNPWPGKPVDVISGKTGAKVVKGANGSEIEFPGIAGITYLVEPCCESAPARRFVPVSGAPSHSARKLGTVQIGLFGDGQ
jgi:hypothetical protein